MFVRKKMSRGRSAFYVVQNRRLKDGRIKQKVVAYLGPQKSIPSAIAHWEAEFEKVDRWVSKAINNHVGFCWRHPDYFERENNRDPLPGERGPIRRLWNLKERRRVEQKKLAQIRKRIALLKRIESKVSQRK